MKPVTSSGLPHPLSFDDPVEEDYVEEIEDDRESAPYQEEQDAYPVEDANEQAFLQTRERAYDQFQDTPEEQAYDPYQDTPEEQAYDQFQDAPEEQAYDAYREPAQPEYSNEYQQEPTPPSREANFREPEQRDIREDYDQPTERYREDRQEAPPPAAPQRQEPERTPAQPPPPSIPKKRRKRSRFAAPEDPPPGPDPSIKRTRNYRSDVLDQAFTKWCRESENQITRLDRFEQALQAKDHEFSVSVLYADLTAGNAPVEIPSSPACNLKPNRILACNGWSQYWVLPAPIHPERFSPVRGVYEGNIRAFPYELRSITPALVVESNIRGIDFELSKEGYLQ